MVTAPQLKKMALSFPEVTEAPHFDLVSFRVNGRIFCTLHEKDSRVMVKLSPELQSVYTLVNKEVIYPVPGGWGKKGATFSELGGISRPLLKELLHAALKLAAAKKPGRKK